MREKPMRRCIMLITFGCVLCTAAYGQEKRLEVTVQYIAGPNVYLNAGTGEGLAPGDTLRVMHRGKRAGAWRVISSSRTKAVVTFTGDPFPVTRGEKFVIVFTPHDGPPPETVSEPGAKTPVEEQRASILSRSRALERPPRKSRRQVRITGRLFMEMNTLRSSTRYQANSLVSRDRTFLTPTAGLRASISNLPGGFRINVNTRVSQRTSVNSTVGNLRSFRIYQASIERTFEAVRFKAGRFYDPFENFSGYWDGLLVRFGEDGFGGGFAAGFEPVRADEQFSSELPKATVFLDYQYRKGAVRYEAETSFHQVRPQNDYDTHTFFGWSQSFRWNRFRLSQNLQVDRHPTTGAWEISRLQLRASIPLTRHLLATGRYFLRRPYYLTRTGDPFGVRRDQGNVGLMVAFTGGTMGLNVSGNRVRGTSPNYTYSSYLNLTRTGLLGLGVSAAASYWSRDSASTLYVSGGISRMFGHLRSRLLFSRYQNDTGTSRLLSHTVTLSLNFPLYQRFFAGIQARTQFGKNLTSTSLYTSIWMRL